eukprot:4123944-Prymnesium_polylepis.1
MMRRERPGRVAGRVRRRWSPPAVAPPRTPSDTGTAGSSGKRGRLMCLGMSYARADAAGRSEQQEHMSPEGGG